MKLWKFWEHKPTTEKHVEVILRDPLKLRLNEFRTNKNMVASAQKILLSSEFRLMMDCAYNEHPAFVVMPEGTAPNDRVVAQARAEGYTMALANLEAMAVFKKPVEFTEPTFEPEDQKPE